MNTEEFTGLYKQLGAVVLKQQAQIDDLTQRVEQLETTLRHLSGSESELKGSLESGSSLETTAESSDAPNDEDLAILEQLVTESEEPYSGEHSESS